MKKHFPIYSRHQDVKCFYCKRKKSLSEIKFQKTEYAIRWGRYKKKCEVCGHSTWYDLKEEVNY